MNEISHVKVFAARSVATISPACYQGRCSDDTKSSSPAVFLLPQVDDGDPAGYTWVPVCEFHAQGWWEPSEAYPAPRPRGYRLVPLATGEGIT